MLEILSALAAPDVETWQSPDFLLIAITDIDPGQRYDMPF
jgi:hypothetical protein